MYSSGGDLHLDLPAGNSDLSQKIWVRPTNFHFHNELFATIFECKDVFLKFFVRNFW